MPARLPNFWPGTLSGPTGSVATSDLPAASIRLSGETWATRSSCSGPRPTSLVLGGRDLQHLERREPATNSATQTLRQQSPFVLPTPVGSSASGQTDLQTFYVVNSTANLVFHAQSATRLWFPSSKIYYSADDTIVSPIGLGKGAIYSVESEVRTPTTGELRTAQGDEQLPAAAEASSLQLPHAYPRVPRHWRRRSPRVIPTTTTRLNPSSHGWAHTRTTPRTFRPSPAGADTVDEFLFGNRVGFCRADLHVARRHVAVDRSPHPRSSRLRAGTVRPDNRPVPGPCHVPTPGSKSGSRASDGRASIPPPPYRWPCPAPARWPSTISAMRSDGSRSCRLQARCSPSSSCRILALASLASAHVGGADHVGAPNCARPARRTSPPPPRDVQRVRHHVGRPHGEWIGGLARIWRSPWRPVRTAATIRRPKRSVKWSGAPGGSQWSRHRDVDRDLHPVA